MQKKYRISLAIITAALIASVLLFGNTSAEQKKTTCCKKTNKECSVENRVESPAETTLEQLSHQFIVLPSF